MERVIELEIGGMTCAACAGRIEKKLNRLDGVTATVNYATEKARATVPAALTADDLIAVVEKTGYTAAEPRPEPGEAVDRDPLRDRLLISAVLSLPVVVLAMVPAWQFTYWQWLSLAAGRAGRRLRRLAVPPGRRCQPAARRGHHGHPGLARHAGRVRLVAVGAVPRRRRPARDDPPVLADRPRRRRRSISRRPPA